MSAPPASPVIPAPAEDAVQTAQVIDVDAEGTPTPDTSEAEEDANEDEDNEEEEDAHEDEDDEDAAPSLAPRLVRVQTVLARVEPRLGPLEGAAATRSA
jgi:hypothetical protein